MAKKVPNLKGKKLEEGRKILEQESIKYVEETKRCFSITTTMDRIVKTKPASGKEIDDKEKVVIYQSRNKLIPLMLVLIAFFSWGIAFGKGVYDTISEQIIEIMDGYYIGAPKLDAEEGKKVVFDKVLMADGKAGNPYLKGVTVEGKVVKQGKGKKLTIFTYVPNKKSTRKKQGHRQPYTKIEITNIK